MARIIDGDLYLSPAEASGMLGISYKTLQRWAEAGSVTRWTGTSGRRKRETQTVEIEMRFTPTGYRLYSSASIQKLKDTFQ